MTLKNGYDLLGIDGGARLREITSETDSSSAHSTHSYRTPIHRTCAGGEFAPRVLDPSLEALLVPITEEAQRREDLGEYEPVEFVEPTAPHYQLTPYSRITEISERISMSDDLIHSIFLFKRDLDKLTHDLFILSKRGTDHPSDEEYKNALATLNTLLSLIEYNDVPEGAIAFLQSNEDVSRK